MVFEGGGAERDRITEVRADQLNGDGQPLVGGSITPLNGGSAEFTVP
ncbi:hypothetical protein ACWDTP_20780 [Mycobacterium sp. NPDC003449]